MRYTIIGGVNGTGKSSFTGVIRAEKDDLGIILDIDKLNAENNGNKIAGGKIASVKINECLKNGYSFTQETTLSGNKTVRTAKAARDLGYTVKLYYIGLDTAAESLKRIKNRVEKGGHDIPEEIVQKRFENRFKSLKAVLPYCNNAVFYDNSNGFTEVAEYKNGRICIKTENIPEWINELLNAY